VVKFSNYLKQKGQGIVEYALLLAFIVGIAMMLNGTNLGGAIKGVFDDAAAVLAGEEKPVAAKDWGHMQPTDYFDEETRLERYDADQQALANLAGLFLNKSKDEVKAILGLKANDQAPTNGTYLGYFVKDDEGKMHFLTRTLALSDDDFSGSITKGTVTRNYNDRVFNWMQGDYGTWGDSGAYQLSYDPTNNYMVSDYVHEQINQGINYWQSENYSPPTGGNGVKLNLHYDSDGRVDKARIAIDQLSQDKSSSSDDKSLYGARNNGNKMLSNGMEVTVTRGQENYEVTRQFKNL